MITEDEIKNKTPAEIAFIFSEAENKLQETQGQLQEKNTIIEDKDKTINLLTHQLRLLKQNRFGRRSEKLNNEDDPQQQIFNEAELAASDAATEMSESDLSENETETVQVPAHTRKRKNGSKALPKDLERERKIYDLTEAEKQCHCGCQMSCIGEEVKEELEIIPAKARVVEHVRKKYVCKQCSKAKANGNEEIKLIFKTADGPQRLIPKSIASPSLLSTIITAKYCDHLPLYRQESIFKRIEVELPRISMSRWMITVGEKIIPLVNLLQDYIIDYDVAYSDETTVQVLKEPDKSPSSKSYMWVFTGGPPDKRVIIYRYQPSRSGSSADEFFAGFKGAIHVDGYAGYNDVAAQDDITRIGCWAHARRKFVEALPNGKMKGISGKVIRLIAELYKIEKNCKEKELSPKEIYEQRQEKSKPILDSIKLLLDDSLVKSPTHSPVHKAIKYTLGQWKYLINYLKDGRYEIDNNRSERAIKPFVIGRKNWLFSNSVGGAKASANLFSLIETAKANEHEPYAYLTHLIERLPYAESLEDYEKLLPFNVSLDLLKKKD